MTATTKMLEAVQAVIEKARKIHDGIPNVTVVLGMPGYTKKAKVFGHFAANTWRDRDGDGKYGELMLSGEGLQRGGKETLGTILHELAHAYAHANDIQDTSNGCRYHNAKFKQIAEDFGLHIEKAPTIGWSVTTVPETTADDYAMELKVLDEALVQYRVPNFELSTSKPQIKRFMQCPKCQDRVPVTKKWFERNESILRCDVHNLFFEMIEEEPV